MCLYYVSTWIFQKASWLHLYINVVQFYLFNNWAVKPVPSFELVWRKKTNTPPLLQGLDYESAKQRILVIAVNNEAPYMLAPHSQQLSQSTSSVTVHVQDLDEGPVFKPCQLRLDVKECEEIGTSIGRYLAEDPETGNSEGIRYETCYLLVYWEYITGRVSEGGNSCWCCIYICVCVRACTHVKCIWIHVSIYVPVHIHVCVYLRSLNKQIILDSYRIPPGQCNWISIDERTGEVRTIKVLDRDVGEMRRGQCNITVLAVDRSEYWMLPVLFVVCNRCLCANLVWEQLYWFRPEAHLVHCLVFGIALSSA